jgi:hypothetical protein
LDTTFPFFERTIQQNFTRYLEDKALQGVHSAHESTREVHKEGIDEMTIF